jgi:hypothetical protein
VDVGDDVEILVWPDVTTYRGEVRAHRVVALSEEWVTLEERGGPLGIGKQIRMPPRELRDLIDRAERSKRRVLLDAARAKRSSEEFAKRAVIARMKDRYLELE